MRAAPELPRLNERIRRSKRTGKIVLSGVLVVSLVLGYVLIQGLLLATDAQRSGVLVRGGLGLGLLAALDLFSVILIRRQHRILDEARDELADIVAGGDFAEDPEKASDHY